MRSPFEFKRNFRIFATINFENSFTKMDCEHGTRKKIVELWDSLQCNAISTAINDALARVVKTHLPKNEAPYTIEMNQGKSSSIAYAFSTALVDSSEPLRRVDAVISVDLHINLSAQGFTNSMATSLRGFKSKLEVRIPNSYQGTMFVAELLDLAEEVYEPIARPGTPTPC